MDKYINDLKKDINLWCPFQRSKVKSLLYFLTVCNLVKYPYSSSDFGPLLSSCISLTSVFYKHTYTNIHTYIYKLYYCICAHSHRNDSSIQLRNETLLFSYSLNTGKSRNDQEEEECMCEHLS